MMKPPKNRGFPLEELDGLPVAQQPHVQELGNHFPARGNLTREVGDPRPAPPKLTDDQVAVRERLPWAHGSVQSREVNGAPSCRGERPLFSIRSI